MERSIDDILSNDEAPEAAPETTEVPIEEVGQPRDQNGRFASKKQEETGVETQPEAEVAPAEQVPPTEQSNQLPPDVYEPLKAIRNENKELKQRLAAIEAAQRQPAPQQPPADFWDDPQAFMAGFGDQLLQQWEQKQQIQRINASEQAARGKHADYDDAYVAFEQAVRLNPSLAYELAQAPDPGEFAYSKGKAAMAIQSVGSLDELRAQIRSELEAEARAAIQPKPTLNLPSTTAADGSVGARTGPAWSGPKSIDDILKS